MNDAIIAGRSVPAGERTGEIRRIMVSMLRQVIARGIAGLLFVGGVVFYFTVYFQPPELETTTLGPMARETYRYSLTKMVDAPEDRPVGISLSMRETSYLLELLLPTARAYGFEVIDVHLRGKGPDAQLQLVYRGPLNFYYRTDWTGQLSFRDGAWKLYLADLSVGRIPVGWALPSRWEPGWPLTWFRGQIQLEEAELDGRGLRARVRRFDVPVRLLLRRPSVPEVESAGVLQPRRDAVDRPVQRLEPGLVDRLFPGAHMS